MPRGTQTSYEHFIRRQVFSKPVHVKMAPPELRQRLFALSANAHLRRKLRAEDGAPDFRTGSNLGHPPHPPY